MWPTIISTFLALATEWIQGCGKDPVTEAQAAYHPDTDSFDRRAVRRAEAHMVHAIHLSKRNMSPEQLHEANSLTHAEIRQRTIDGMRAGLNATSDDVARFALAAKALPDGADDGGLNADDTASSEA